MRYHFKIHKEKKGYWANCVELSGCNTQGDSLQELKENATELLNLFLSEDESSNVTFPMPKKIKQNNNILEIDVEPNIAFSLLLRYERKKSHFTQSQVAKKLGMKNIYNYQRLEKSKTANPALKTLKKVKDIFPKLKLESIIN